MKIAIFTGFLAASEVREEDLFYWWKQLFPEPSC